jgi:hypothetical protein
VDLVLGLDVAVLGRADVDAHPRGVEARELEPGMRERLVCTVDGDAPGPRPPANLLLALVPERIERADPREGLAHVANLPAAHAGDARQQARAELLQ